MGLAELANKGIHTKVINHFRNLPKGKVLDLPCGPGALSKALKDMGHDVIAGDIHPEHMQAQGIQAQFCDMNTKLPFKDKAFDYIACVEGIEHT
ncbi:MAG: class I SAM-dependent methyltransferase, partial [Thermodesulfobacteriota bacterium]|nr:class I SAM-dependent methyltransferase [Thermodesulfobacteriota bacterium]